MCVRGAQGSQPNYHKISGHYLLPLPPMSLPFHAKTTWFWIWWPSPTPHHVDWLGEPIIIQFPSFPAHFADRSGLSSSLKTFKWESARPPSRKARCFIKRENPRFPFLLSSEIVVPILGKKGRVQGNRPETVAAILGQEAKSMRVIAHVPGMEKYGKTEGAHHELP